MRRIVVLVALLIGLATLAIATGSVDKVVEWRVKTALVDAGVPEKRAICMAARMVDRLSIMQLHKLQNMEPQAGELTQQLSLGDYVERVRRIDDAEVVAVTGTSAALCAAGIG